MVKDVPNPAKVHIKRQGDCFHCFDRSGEVVGFGDTPQLAWESYDSYFHPEKYPDMLDDEPW